jgi:hypothetical protein
MSGTNWMTVLVGALIAVLPQMAGVIPAPGKDIATAIITAIVAVWHLYQPSPSAASK